VEEYRCRVAIYREKDGKGSWEWIYPPAIKTRGGMRGIEINPWANRANDRYLIPSAFNSESIQFVAAGKIERERGRLLSK
jgi:hypothetical protein